MWTDLMWIVAVLCFLAILATLIFATPDDVKRETHFFVTAVDVRDGVIKDTRCVGYTKTFKEAEEAVLENMGDLHESTNQWAVIEEMSIGVWSHATRFIEEYGVYQWYKWEGNDEGHYVKCEIPEWATNILNWGIG